MTLLELLLSLALTGVVMVIISMAIHLHLFTLDTRRADVEEALLARAVLRHMATDLRNAVWYEPLEMSSLVGAGAAADTSSVPDTNAADAPQSGGVQPPDQRQVQSPSQDPRGPASAPEGSDASASDGLGSDDLEGLGLTDEPSENTADIAGMVAPASVPGLYGNQYELSVDCSRLPRVDQYGGTEDAATGAVSIPSDVKTVSYFLRTEDSPQVNALATDGGNALGLVRRELDRAAACWASQEGSLDASQHPGSVLAQEVTYLEFRYYDGTTWYTEWDSDQMGGLPTAIEITISIDPAFGRNVEDLDVRTANELAAVADQDEPLYRLVVHLPIAQPLTTDATLGDFDESSMDFPQGGTEP